MLSDCGVQIVYWLGAGASAKALPVVSEMPEALRTQCRRIAHVADGGINYPDALRRYDAKLHNLAELSIAYGSLDTYARSLYLLEKRELLADLKLHLSLFFYLETLILPGNQPQYIGYTGYNKGYDVDPRYMGWFALLLNDGLKMNARVKVISWNYDCQVELALARYCDAGGVAQMHDKYSIHPTTGDEQIGAQNFFLTHLNGIAGQEKRGDKYYPWYNSLAGFYPDKLNAAFALYDVEGSKWTTMQQGFIDRMTFAWEKNETAGTAIDLAEAALRSADVLVVIGYSFPAFNRLIDDCLLGVFSRSGTTIRKLVIQHPTMQEEHIKNMFDLDWDNIKLVMDANCDQFHLPNELFAEQ
jgi:hypothetical protein